jgi:2-dehydro-3-deoxyglucarate aldolase/4-hydroxy-2-oxoheptanedioate aldolase
MKERLANELTGTMVFEFFSPGPRRSSARPAPTVLLRRSSAADTEAGSGAVRELSRGSRSRRGACPSTVPLHRPVLDAGAHGVMVPMVDSVDDAKRAVRSMQYPPEGRRGSAFGMAHDDYLPGAPVDKIAAARARNVLIALIETPGGVAAADEIAALPGVDILWLGHFDLTNFMGIPGQFDHPDYLAAVDRIVAAARRHGKPAGFLALDDDWARRYHAKGFRVMAYGLDSQLLLGALRRGI